MRIILLSAFLSTLPVPSLADHTVGCGSGIQQSDIPIVDNLKYTTDRYLTSHCFFTPALRPGNNTWLFSLPAIQWHQSYPGKTSRSERSAQYQRWFVSWPLARLKHHHLLLKAKGGNQQLTSEFRDNTLWTPTNQVFALQQSLLLKQTRRELALTVKVFRPYSVLNRFSLQHTLLQQPISIRQRLPSRAEVLTPARIQHYSIAIGAQQQRRGWNVPWQFALGHGTFEDDENNYLAADNGLRKGFNYLALRLAGNYRWRLSRQLQISAVYQLDWQYYDFSDAREEDSLQIRDSSSLQQQFNVTAEWRF